MHGSPQPRSTASCLLALALVACEGRPAAQPGAQPGASATASPPAGPEASPVTTPAPPAPPPATATPSPADAKVAPTPPAPTLPTPAPDATFDGPTALVALEGGALVVWSRHDAEAGKSDLLVASLDERGVPVGEARLLRRTSGEVLDVSASRKGGDVWIAWLSLLAADPRPRALVAAARLASDLSSVSSPITLNQFSEGDILDWPGGAMLRALALADGEGVIAARSRKAECTDTVEGHPTTCPGFDLFWVRPDDTFTLAGHFGADGGDPGLGSLVDVGTGVLFDVWAWHGGPTFASAFASRGQPIGEPPFPLLDCRPPFSRGWTGAELVTLCPADYADEGERCVVDGVPAEEETCARLSVVRPGGKRSPAPPLTSQKERCHDGHPVVEVAHAKGKLRLDPQRPGASLDLDLGEWTGRFLLSATNNGVGARRRCEPGGELVADGEFDLRPLLLAPTQALRHVPARKAGPGDATP